MPSDRIDGTLRDILHHIDLAAEFAKGLDCEAFAADLRTVYAVTAGVWRLSPKPLAACQRI